MKNNWLDRNEYPFTSRYYDVEGSRLHYIDEGEGQILLFVHGTPSWSFDFRNVFKALRHSYRCIAIDHIGFGLSDKPSGVDYSTLAHSKRLERFIIDLNLHDISFVLHDFGGPIGFHFAICCPERVKNLIILNSWMWSSEGDPEYIRIKKVLKSPLMPLLYRYFNFSPRFILPRSFGDRKLSKKIQAQYTAPFLNRKQREGMVAFAHSLLNDQEWFQKLWESRDIINDKPALMIWGMKDPILSPIYLKKFQEGFPLNEVVALPTCGHFPQEENPKEVVEAIQSWMVKRST